MIVRVKGIKKARAKGKIYYYDRVSGQRIKAPPNTPEFIEEVRLKRLPQKNVRNATAPGTLGALITDYRESSEFTSLAPRTRGDYHKIFDWFAPIDGVPLAQIDTPAVLKIREKAFRAKKRRFANRVHEVIRLIFGWGLEHGNVTTNPALGLKKIPRPKNLPKANRAWTDEECDIVLAEATGGLLVAIALGMYSALRIDMARTIKWSALSTDGMTLSWQHKNDLPNVLPVHRALREILETTPRAAVTIVTSELGRPYRGGLAKAFRTLILKLEREGRVGPGLTFHGLRHTAGKALADLGADPRTIAAMLGQKSVSMAIHYSEEVDRLRRGAAAIVALEGRKKRT
jgi:integrase